MHPTILIQRKAQAVNRILAKAEALAKHLDLDPALIEALQPKGAKDAQVLEMFRLEGLANLFDQLAISAGVLEPVTTVTGADEPPAGETEPEAAADQDAVLPIVMGPDGLPAPTLDKARTGEPEAQKSAEEGQPEAIESTKPEAEEPAEVTEPEAIESTEPEAEEPVEEEPAPEPPVAVKKSTTRKRSKK
jgi:hypothetical protein